MLISYNLSIKGTLLSPPICLLIVIFLLLHLFLSPLFHPVLLLLLSTQHTRSLQHFNLFCCSPSLNAAPLVVSPPWLCSLDSTTPQWLLGTMVLHKGLGRILRHQIPAAQGDSCSKSHSPAKTNTLNCTHT